MGVELTPVVTLLLAASPTQLELFAAGDQVRGTGGACQRHHRIGHQGAADEERPPARAGAQLPIGMRRTCPGTMTSGSVIRVGLARTMRG